MMDEEELATRLRDIHICLETHMEDDSVDAIQAE